MERYVSGSNRVVAIPPPKSIDNKTDSDSHCTAILQNCLKRLNKGALLELYSKRCLIIFHPLELGDRQIPYLPDRIELASQITHEITAENIHNRQNKIES